MQNTDYNVLLILNDGTFIEKKVSAESPAMAQSQAKNTITELLLKENNTHVVGGCSVPSCECPFTGGAL